MLTPDLLHPYQHKAIQFLIEKRRCALFIDMGLGKSVTSLTTIAQLKRERQINKVLIIAPLRVANTVWKQEAAQWSHTKHLAVSIATGSEKNRREALAAKADVYVINRENVSWLVKTMPWDFDCVVIDESSSFKSHSADRFKKLKTVIAKPNYVWLLTGTPSPNGIADLWAQMYLIDGGKRLGRTISAFRSRFFQKTGYMGYTYEALPGADKNVQALITDKCLSMAASDYLSLPERIDVNRFVELPDSAAKQYARFKKDCVTQLNDVDIDALTAAALINKLLQFSNGAVYDAEGAYHVVHDEKINALKEIVDDNPNESVLVAYNFKSDLERLKRAFPNATVLDKSSDTIDTWNAGKISMLLAHPQSAGHGLNIQKGGSLCVWFGLTWSLEAYQQFNARLHRQGQTKPVRIIHLLGKDTADNQVLACLMQKDKSQSALLTALKETL